MTTRALKVLAAAATALLLVSGCGSSAEDDASSAADATATEAPAHAAEFGEPDLPEVPGYAYSDFSGVDAKDLSALQAELDAANEEMPGTFVAMAGHEVTGPSGEELGVLQLQVGPAVAKDPELMSGFTAGLVSGMAAEGLTVKVAPMGDVDVAQGTDDYGWSACSWSQGDMIFMVFGDDEDAVNDYTAAVIKACQPR